MDRQIRISGRVVVAAAAVLLVVAVFAIPATRDRIVSGFAPRTVASAAELAEQRDHTERSIARGYKKALDQLSTARRLRLPIPEAEADRIFRSSVAQLGSLRREALGAVGEAYGLGQADIPAYVAQAEARIERLGSDTGSALLAPRLYAIVLRFDQLAQDTADKGTEAMTIAPSPSPGR
ncbi:MAG TPA: hypothetical protein VFM93_07830 [Candidatus Limnocylindria bacterium]|nr:hypothetical protein [Candidatus Limnocylindria bacterium]